MRGAQSLQGFLRLLHAVYTLRAMDRVSSSSPGKSAFISHGSADDGYVMEFQSLLHGLGYARIFNDGYSIGHGDEFWPAVETGIREHEDFFVVLSHDSVKSKWVVKEIEFARDIGRKIRGIRIDDCRVPDVISDLDVINLRTKGYTQKISPPRFLHHRAEHFLGREAELAMLDKAWADGLNVLSLVAWGGVGKTALIAEWVQTRFVDRQWKTAAGRPDPVAYFDWTFYDQSIGSLDDPKRARTGSVGDFFEKALIFFGDKDPNAPGKGARLADLIRQQRSLVILDGIEPLQHPLQSPQAGRFTDPDLSDLLRALAAQNPGLCLVTSRQALTDLPTSSVTQSHDLNELSTPVAVRLLRQLQVIGSDEELEKAVAEFDRHALSLTLLGRFLVDAHGGDVRRIDQVHRHLHEADDLTRPERHRTAWKVLAAYERWLNTHEGDPQTLAVLRLMGLFDRPASPGCLAALRAEPIISGLTDHIHAGALNVAKWHILLKRLDKARLLKLRDDPNQQSAIPHPQSVDAHPLVREYFAEQLRTMQPEAFRAAHSRLFGHLCKSTEHRPDTLVGLQPLYQAVTHGCLAGRQHEAFVNVYADRIVRGVGEDGDYSWRRLGAISADLGAMAAFFEEPWSRLSPNLSTLDQALVLGEASFRLRALGRVTEALEPMQMATKYFDGKDAKQAAVGANNLSELRVVLGHLSEAIKDSRHAILLADRSGDTPWKMWARITSADALHQSGQPDEREEAQRILAGAERIPPIKALRLLILVGMAGLRYADLQLAPVERMVWRRALPTAVTSGSDGSGSMSGATKLECFSLLAVCDEIRRRMINAQRELRELSRIEPDLLATAANYLTLARIALYEALLSPTQERLRFLAAKVPSAVSAFRQSNMLHNLPLALLTAAFYHGTLGGDLDAAERLLAEVQDIAERGPMPLYLADVHLHRARLFGKEKADSRQQRFPEINPKTELIKARALIEKHGYWRRKEELEAAEAAATLW